MAGDPTRTADTLSRLDTVAENQLTLLESTIRELRSRMNSAGLDIDEVTALGGQIGWLSSLMLQWADVLLGTPVNEDEEGDE